MTMTIQTAPPETRGFVDLPGARLEFLAVGDPGTAPAIVLLHEGLGSVSAWRDFPQRLSRETGLPVLAYSRAGYGHSSPVSLPRPLDYMERESLDVLPQVLDALGFTEGILLGHSDGASIAAIYAGSVQDHRVRGLVLLAPHFFVEDRTVEAIEEMRERWRTTDLRSRLARHHDDVDGAFLGWNGAWLDPAFRAFDITECLAYIRVPMLIVQGDADPYGSLRQVEVAVEECMAPVESLVLQGCGHAPQAERPAETLAAVAAFINDMHDPTRLSAET